MATPRTPKPGRPTTFWSDVLKSLANAGDRRQNARQVELERFPFRRALQWLAGADPQLLAMAPSEGARYAAAGASIVLTSILSMLSFTFLLSLSGFDLVISTLIGLLWGLLVLNLERPLLATGRYSSLFNKISVALLRLIFSIMIGVTTSVPLALAVFSTSIESKLNASGVTGPYSLLQRLQIFGGTPEFQPAANLIVLLFASIEVLPTLFWILLTFGPPTLYDELARRRTLALIAKHHAEEVELDHKGRVVETPPLFRGEGSTRGEAQRYTSLDYQIVSDEGIPDELANEIGHEIESHRPAR